MPIAPIRSTPLTVLCVAALLAAGPANAAGTYRVYLSAKGFDSSPCALSAPCRLLPAALAAVTDGGEIWMLDSANFNTGQVNVEVKKRENKLIDVNTPGADVQVRRDPATGSIDVDVDKK